MFQFHILEKQDAFDAELYAIYKWNLVLNH